MQLYIETAGQEYFKGDFGKIQKYECFSYFKDCLVNVMISKRFINFKGLINKRSTIEP